MILIGLIGVLLVSNLEKGDESTNTVNTKTQVEK